jgi:hypothetical protein
VSWLVLMLLTLAATQLKVQFYHATVLQWSLATSSLPSSCLVFVGCCSPIDSRDWTVDKLHNHGAFTDSDDRVCLTLFGACSGLS